MKRVIAISLATLILFSSVGFTFGTHYCGGHAVLSELVLGHEHLDCGMTDMDQECAKPDSGHSLMAKSCCNNEYVQLYLDDDLQNGHSNLTVDHSFLVALVMSLNHPERIEESNELFFSDQHPPPLEQDYQVLYQTFLI